MNSSKKIKSISMLVLFTFLFSFLPHVPVMAEVENNTKANEKTLVKNESEAFAVVVGDFLKESGNGSDWEPRNMNGVLKKYKNGLYEGTLKLKAGNYNYKIAMNGTWDESYGNNGQNIALNLSKDSEVIFRLDYKNKKVYDSINNPDQFKTKAILAGNIKDIIDGASDWNPGNDTEKLDYIGGGMYKKTFPIKESAQGKDISLEYKVAYNGEWNNGEVAENAKVVIPKGTKNITILSNYLDNYVKDSINNPSLSNTVSLIGTVREGNGDWDVNNKNFEMHNLDENRVLYSKIMKKGTYECKGLVNHSWDNGGIPSQGKVTLNVPEDRNVIFVADLKNNKIYDSINNTKEINEALGIKGDENTGEDNNGGNQGESENKPDSVKSPVVNEDGTVTFSAKFNGDSLYLIGSMVSWDTSKQIEMKKGEDGVFKVTIPLTGGVYEYKFKPNKDNWDNSFTDPSNKVMANGNSVLNMPGLEIGGESSVEVGSNTKLVAYIYDTEGNKKETNVNWSLEEPVSGVSIEENTLKVSKDVDSSKKIKIKATDGKYSVSKELAILSQMYTYTINYYRFDGNYDNWNLWLWQTGGEGKGYDFNKKDEAEKGFTRAVYKFPSDKLNFLIRKGNWEDKDVGHDRTIEVKNGNNVEVWLIQGDENIYYDKKDVDTSPKLISALMDSKTDLLVTSAGNIEDSELDSFKLIDKTDNKEIKTSAIKVSDNKVKLTLKKGFFSTPEIDLSHDYEVSSNSFRATKVTMRKILDDPEYFYNGDDLGVTYKKDSSTFKLWAPTAKEVSLVLYDNEGTYDENGKVTDNTGGREISMKKENKGVWSLKVDEDLEGKYYMYKVSFSDGKTNYAIDPYAKAVSANGQRGAIIDFSSTNPSEWGSVKKPPMLNPTDSILYEMHVRDFSISKDSGINNKGKFEGIAEEGTKVPGTDVKTGIDHLKELGITTVHLLPSFDYASVNEISNKPQFNWGYDPQNYNSLEGSYSTNAEDPKSRVREFKDMVQTLHKNGIRVVMDVVYNHTYGIGQNSPFDPVVPGYFYRTNDEGKYTNGSGCGNEVATERPMVRKYIKDSVKYLAKEYDVDGFRFDLMGLIDTKTMSELTTELRNEIDPSLIIYGEPWQAGGSALPQEQQTLKGSQKGKGFAVFNDNFRNAIKGDSDGAGQGFATGASSKEGDIVAGIKGSVDDFTDSPSETINYVTAHDNLNLWDKIIKAAGKEKAAGFLEMRDGDLTGEDANNYSSVQEAVEKKAKPYSVITETNPLDNEYVRRSILTTAITMTSQGIPFFQAGDEFLRSKYGDQNSYKSPDAINQINWQNKEKFSGVFDYYQGLIALRKSHPVFRMDKKAAIESNLVVTKSNDNIVVFQLKNFANGDSWKNIVVAYNGNNAEKEISLPHEGDWNVVVNEHKAGTSVLESLKGVNSVKVAPLSAKVLYDESVEGEAQTPTSIDVTPSSLKLDIGASSFLKAVVKDQNGRIIPNAEIKWNISDNSVIKVDSNNGKVTALKEGKSIITLSSGSLTKDVEVEVVHLVPSSLELDGPNQVYTGKDIQLNGIVKDQFGQIILGANIEWFSSDESIAKVSTLGVVQGISEGKVKITAKSGKTKATKEIEVKKYTKKYIEFTYVRDDKDYDGWNIWTWQTGVNDGQQNFTQIKDGKAISKFEIAPDVTQVGFVLRKGTGWDEKDPYESDRYIQIDPSMNVTKVTVKSGVGEFFQVPAIKNAEIQGGNINFKYRDKALYEDNNQSSIDKVQVKVTSPGVLFKDTKTYDMDYDSQNEFFAYSLKDIKPGTYEYSFLVTKDGKTVETEKQRIEYSPLKINGEVTFKNNQVNYDENAITNLKLSGSDAKKENIKEVYMDLTNVGGPNKVLMDLNLLKDNSLSQSIGINDNVVAGEKEIPVTIVDKNGENHKAKGILTVKSKVGVGPLDFGFDESRIYFTVTDRFFNGDKNNDDPHGNNYDKKNPYTYHGGDLKGLTDKIPYLKELGINTIWITPIVENTDFNQMFSQGKTQYSYHGYWAKDFEKLDPHLGTMDDLKTLIDTAHDSGIKIMVDVVLNHAGYGMKNKEANSGANNYPTEEDRAKFKGMFRENPGNDFITQESAGLPDFKTEDPEVREKLIEWQTGWIERSKTEKGNTIDYFRVDTVKHVDNTTWKAFKNKLTEINPSFKTIGEYFGADINNDGGQLQNGQMDALLDFGYKGKARDFVNGNIEGTSAYLDDRASKISNTNLMGQFLSSHDEDGFLKTVGDDLGKQMLAASLQITDKGIPVIYYGEELGMSGWNGFEQGDQNRYDMDFERLNDPKYKKVHDHYEKLLNIRKEYSKVFSKGNRKTIAGNNEEGYSVVLRSYNGKEITPMNLSEKNEEKNITNGQNLFVVLNTKNEGKDISFKTNFKEGEKVKDLYSGKEYSIGKDGKVTVKAPSKEEGGTAILALKNDSLSPSVINNAPEINAKDVTLTVGDKFDPMEGVIAMDKEDGEITKDIKVIENNVDTEKSGDYKVIYKVTDSEGASKTKEINVKVNEKETTPPEEIKVTGVKLNNKDLNLKKGEKYVLKAEISPKDATNKEVTWISSNPKVVSVDENGNIEAKSSGEAEITVTTKDGGFKSTCKVKVKHSGFLPNTGSVGGRIVIVIIGIIAIGIGIAMIFYKRKVIRRNRQDK
ncbi:MAG: type I pullulanase [Clostridium perfringens]|nr:type I pullulanase [Clostridium perfringens]MDU8989605.1 type I pullulanase [Clostridium perfringens]